MGLIGAIASGLFYVPIWAVGMNLLEAVVNDFTAYSCWYPPWEVARQEYLAGFFPLWLDVSESPPNVYVWVSAYMNPLLLWTIPFEFSGISDIYFIGRVWLMGFFAYIFARRCVLMGKHGAALTAVAFAFSGIAQKRMVTVEMNVPWLIPLFLLTLRETLLKPRFSLMIACGAVSAFSLYAGHPIAAFYMFIIGGLWVLYLWFVDRFSIKRLILLFGAGLISLFLSSPQLIPGLEALSWDWNYHFIKPLDGSSPVEGIFSLALPWLVGANKSNLATAQLAPYLGAVPFLLAVFGLAVLRRLGRCTPFFAMYGIVFLGLGYALPVFSALGYIPPLSRLVNSASAYPTVTLAAAIVAGAALDLVIKDASESRILLKWALGAAAVTLVAGAYAWWLIENLRSDPRTAVFFTDPMAAYQSLKSQLIFGCTMFLVLGVVIAWFPKRGKVAAACVVFLAFWGLFVDALGWNHENPGLFEKLRKSDAVQYVQTNIHQGATIVTQCEFLDPNLYKDTWIYFLACTASTRNEKRIGISS